VPRDTVPALVNGTATHSYREALEASYCEPTPNTKVTVPSPLRMNSTAP
jgi:hypothetical protein